MGGADGYLGMQQVGLLAGQTTLYGPSAGQTERDQAIIHYLTLAHSTFQFEPGLTLSLSMFRFYHFTRRRYSPFVSFKFPDFQLKMRQE